MYVLAFLLLPSVTPQSRTGAARHMDTNLKPGTTQRQPKLAPATLERQKLDCGSQFSQILNKLTKPKIADIKPQPAALAPLVKPCAHLELASLKRLDELYIPGPAALERVEKARVFIQTTPTNKG